MLILAHILLRLTHMSVRKIDAWVVMMMLRMIRCKYVCNFNFFLRLFFVINKKSLFTILLLYLRFHMFLRTAPKRIYLILHLLYFLFIRYFDINKNVHEIFAHLLTLLFDLSLKSIYWVFDLFDKNTETLFLFISHINLALHLRLMHSYLF